MTRAVHCCKSMTSVLSVRLHLAVQDGPAKKRGRGGDDADADGAPASKGFNLGLPAPAFSAAAADGASAGSGFTMPSGTNAFGQSQLFSFGPAAALTGLSNKDAKEPQSGQDEAPAETIPASAGFAAVPSFLGAGGKPVEAASGGQLNPAAKPFTLNFGVGGLPKFGAEEPQPDDAKQDADAPAINGAAAGLPLSEVQHAALFLTMPCVYSDSVWRVTKRGMVVVTS